MAGDLPLLLLIDEQPISKSPVMEEWSRHSADHYKLVMRFATALQTC
jgi:hypothetical protein